MIFSIVTGNLGADAEVKEIAGHQRLTFSVASTDRKSDGTKVTTWIDCVYNAVSVQPYLKKGTSVTVMGQSMLKQFQGKDGSVKAQISVWASHLDFRTSKPEESQQYATSIPQSAIPVATVPTPAPADNPDLPF